MILIASKATDVSARHIGLALASGVESGSHVLQAVNP